MKTPFDIKSTEKTIVGIKSGSTAKAQGLKINPSPTLEAVSIKAASAIGRDIWRNQNKIDITAMPHHYLWTYYRFQRESPF